MRAGSRRGSTRLVLGLALSLCCAIPSWSWAQDEWGVERDDLRQKKIERYKELVNRSPEEGYAFKQLMKTVGRGRDYDKLVEEYEARVKASPDDFNARMLLGHMLRYGSHLARAQEQYEAAIALDGTALAHESLGTVHEANKALDDAVTSYEKALELSSDREQKERILRALGSMALHRRHLDKAKGYFERLVQLDAKNLFLRKELAQLLIENKLLPEALAQLEAALKLAGSNQQVKTQLMLDIGEVYELQDRNDEAIALYRDAASKVTEGNWLRLEVEERVIGIYRRKNDIAGLVKYYEDSWGAPDFDQMMILARLYEELGDETKALDYVGRAIKKRPKDADARLKLIQLVERTGDTLRVIAAYRELIAALPGDAKYRFDLADLLYRSQRKDEAVTVLEKTGAAFKNDAEVHVRLADKYMSWDLRDKALGEYKLLVKLQADDPAHLESLGEFFFQEGKRDEAVETWKRVLKVIKSPAEAHVYLGRVYADHAMLDEAVAEYKLAMGAEPDSLQVQRDLGEVYERARRFIDAVAVWEEILAKAPDQMLRREARQHIIAIFHQQGTLRANLYQYERKFEQTPPDLESGYFLAEAFLKLNELESAARTLERILETQPEDLEAMIALEKAYTELGDHDRAVAVLERLAEVDPNRARVYFQKIADAYLKRGDPDAAERWMVETLRVNANDARSYAKLGDVYRKKQQLDKAAEMYEEALQVDARAFEHYFVLADIYAQLHRDVDADRLHRSIVKQAIDESMVLRAAYRAIEFNEFAGTLSDLEQDLLPLLHKTPRRPVYGRILIDLYVAMTQKAIARARSGDPQTRTAARQELEEVGRRAIKPLLDALASEDGSMRSVALDLLGELNNPNAAPPLALMLDDPNPEVQLRAALALARLSDARAIPALTQATTSRYIRPVREIAAWGLGRSESRDAIAVLEELAQAPDFQGVIALSAIGLARLGGGGDALVQLLRHRAPTVRGAAAWAVGHAGVTPARSALLVMLREDEELVAALAAWSLGAIGGDDAVDPLLDAYWGGRPVVRTAAGHALRRLALGGASPEAHSLWEENAAFINLASTERGVDVDGLLRELLLGEEQALAPDGGALFARYGKDLERGLRRHLGDESGALVVKVLRDLDDGQGSLGLGGLQAGDTGPLRDAVVAVAPELRRLLVSRTPALRWHAASLLGKVGDREAVEPLIAVMRDDPERDVRRMAALALGRIRDERGYAPLVEALGSEYFGLRGQAAWALGLLGDARAFDALVDVLGDDYSYVSGLAARGLGALGDARAVDVLAERLEGAPPSVQVELVRALTRLGAADRAAPLAESADIAVRQAVSEGRR